MSTVEEIETAISCLSMDELFRVREFVQGKFEDGWDKQMEEDAVSGKLDGLAQEALAEFRAGKTKAFPPNG